MSAGAVVGDDPESDSYKQRDVLKLGRPQQSEVKTLTEGLLGECLTGVIAL